VNKQKWKEASKGQTVWQKQLRDE